MHNLFYRTIIANFSYGQHHRGVAKGGNEIYALVKNLCKNTLSWQVKSNVPIGNHGWQNEYFNIIKYSYGMQSTCVLGGDHSIGQQSVITSMLRTNPKNLYVLWIDAHADINTYDASQSKNYHGMPLAGLVGNERPWTYPFTPKMPLKYSHLMYYGLRDMDSYEENLVEQKRIFNTSNFKQMTTKLQNIIMNNPDAVFHVSFDVDALDPQHFDGTGCLSPNGLHPNDVAKIINYIKNRTICLDIVEFNPELGNYTKNINVLNKLLQRLI